MNFPLGGWVGLCFDLLTIIRYIFHITHITYHLSLITRILCRRNAKQKLVDVAAGGKVYRAGLFHDILANFPMDSALRRAFVYLSLMICVRLLFDIATNGNRVYQISSIMLMA